MEQPFCAEGVPRGKLSPCAVEVAGLAAEASAATDSECDR